MTHLPAAATALLRAARSWSWLLVCCCTVAGMAAELAPDELLARGRHARGSLPDPAVPQRQVLDATELLHPDVTLRYTSEIVWSPAGYREIQTLGDYVLLARNWDGRELLFAESHRLRHPLRKDHAALVRAQELQRVLDLAIAAPEFACALLPDQPYDGVNHHHLEARHTPSGRAYRLLFHPTTGVLRCVAWQDDDLYGGAPQSTAFRLELHDDVQAPMPGPTELRLYEDEALKLTCRVVSREALPQLPGDAFTAATLRQALLRHSPFPPANLRDQKRYREAILQHIDAYLKRRATGRWSRVLILAQPLHYRRALLDGEPTVLIAPKRLGPHVSGHYQPMDLDPRGIPRLDVITLRESPEGPDVDELTLLHETSHLILRQYQAAGRLLADDDEDLVAFQEEMTYLAVSLDALERAAFTIPREDHWEQTVQRHWGHALFRYRYALAEHQLTPQQLAQLERLTGCRYRLEELRDFYVRLDIPAELLPLTLTERFESFLLQLDERQRKLRAEWLKLPPPEPLLPPVSAP